ncbi:Protein RTA1-like protein 9 [Purpureocillium lavendulum]|uniref:Protein RTA1-like protein 9 n=1 Tax=Purpureocillium lavendulum TaxID=1247861 RepID=A0AB34FH33_9HYPO|nr:Protein RTA1-like protein 9 [Purpureocillium lavendulum]
MKLAAAALALIVSALVCPAAASPVDVAGASALEARAFDAQPQDAAPDSSHGGTAIAIHNYNAAIRNIAQHPTDLDAVLLVCALFVCIEFLRGNAQAAISHAAHGISLLNSSPQKSEFTPIFRHLSIFPMFFGASVSSFPVMAESESHVDAFRFTELPDALESLDALLARSSLEVSLHEQHALQSDLGRWWKSFSAIRDQDRYATGHDTTFQVLEMRYLVAEIWTSACLDEDEAAYDAHHEKFKRIVEIATEAHHDLKTHSARGNKFTFSMGFCPLLQFVVLKCRYLKVRIAALALMKTLASQREALWDYEIMHAVGRRIIEIEHGVCVAPPEEVRYQDLEDGVQALSDDGLRVLDNSLVSEQTDKGGSKGVVGRTICLLLRRSGGEVEVRYDQLNLGSGDFTTTKYITIDGETNSQVTIPGQTIAIAIPTCVQTATPDANGHVPPGTCGAIWNYYPSFYAAMAFAILFAILVGIHIWQAAMYEKRWCWVIIMATIWETTAMTFRSLSSKAQQNDGIYLVFQIFILLAPLWVNAFAYMTLGRMIYYFHPSRAITGLPAATVAAMFVFLDFASFVVQLVGGSMASPSASPEKQKLAINIYMGGIACQELIIIVVVGLCVTFQLHMKRLRLGARGLFNSGWGQLLCTLYWALAMITVRIIYRLVEFSGGVETDSALTTQEGYFYALEVVPMFLALGSFNVVHPGRIMNGPGSDMPGLFRTIKTRFMLRKGKQPLADDMSERDLRSGWEMT